MVFAEQTEPMVIIEAQRVRDDEPTEPSDRHAEPTERVETQCDDAPPSRNRTRQQR